MDPMYTKRPLCLRTNVNKITCGNCIFGLSDQMIFLSLHSDPLFPSQIEIVLTEIEFVFSWHWFALILFAFKTHVFWIMMSIAQSKGLNWIDPPTKNTFLSLYVCNVSRAPSLLFLSQRHRITCTYIYIYRLRA